MAPAEEFYELLSGLLQHAALTPKALPFIPLENWLNGSPERRVLEDLLATLKALQDGSQNHLAQA